MTSSVLADSKAPWPSKGALAGLDEREYRISQGHDSAAALIVDGIPVAAAAEERSIVRSTVPTSGCLNSLLSVGSRVEA